jgi:hypothetical protein
LIIANAQLENTEELREEQRAREIEEEFSSEQGQDQDDKEATTTTGSNKLSLTLGAHFIPLSPLSDKCYNGSVCRKPNIAENLISSRTNCNR